MNVVITANGQGERMKQYGVPKHELPYKGLPIIEHLLNVFPNAYVLTHYDIKAPNVIKCEPTKSRKETLQNLANWRNVLIVDCDIYIKEFPFNHIYEDTVFFKYGNEPHFQEIEPNIVCSGLYYVQSMNELLKNMDDDSIYSGMKEATMCYQDSIHLGTPHDYSSRL